MAFLSKALLVPMFAAVAAGTPASAQLVVGDDVTGSITLGGTEQLDDTDATIGDGGEFRAQIFDNSIFGPLTADAFVDLDETGATLGFERTAGSSGISSESPVVFTIDGLDFDEPIADITTSVPNGDTRDFDASLDGDTLTVSFPDGFFLGSNETADLVRVGFVPIPEPTAVLVLAPAAGLFLRRRR